MTEEVVKFIIHAPLANPGGPRTEICVPANITTENWTLVSEMVRLWLNTTTRPAITVQVP